MQHAYTIKQKKLCERTSYLLLQGLGNARIKIVYPAFIILFCICSMMSSLMFTYFPPHETSPGTVSKWVIIQIFISSSSLVIWTYLMPIKTCSDYKIIHPFQFLIRLLTHSHV